MNEIVRFNELQLYKKLEIIDKTQAQHPVLDFLEEFGREDIHYGPAISSMRIFRLMMEDIFPVLRINDFSMKSGNTVYAYCDRICEYYHNDLNGNGFIHPMRGKDRFPNSLIPLWLFYYFDYKNYGAVKNLKPTVRGLLTNLGVIQSSIKNAYYNSPPGPGMSKKEKEIENMYIEEFGDVDVFRGRGDTMLPQTEAKLLIKATNHAGFHYNNGSIQ